MSVQRSRIGDCPFMARWRSWVRDQEGVVALESAWVMPLLLMLTVAFLFVSLYGYRQTDMQYAAASAVQRASSTWTCCGGTSEEALAGMDRTGLYWRWREGASWSWLEGRAFASDGREVRLPADGFVPATSMQRKLLAAAGEAAQRNATGALRFNSGVILSTVEGELEVPFSVPTWMHQPVRHARGDSRSSVVEPVEWMRNLALIGDYAKELQVRFIDREEAEQKVYEFLDLHSPGTFSRHNEAAAYLRQLVSGREHMVQLSESRRLIDALTANGVAHQAYLTFTEKQIREQMAKDIEMLAQGGDVSGVVWHFFRRTGQTGRVGPSDALLKDLYANGIVVVIHDG